MPAALRPMNLGEILDRTFEIYRKRFLLFAGIAALPAAVMLALHLADISWLHTEHRLGFDREPEGGKIALGWFLAYGYYHISGFVGLLFQPAFVRASSREIFAESNSILASLRFTAARWRTYLWLAFLKMCAQLVIPEALAFGALVGIAYLSTKLKIFESPNSAAILVFSFIAAIFVAFLWISIALAFAMPAAALEQLSAWKSLRRSWRLTRSSRGRILVAWIMAVTCALVLESVAALLAWWIASLAYAGHHAPGYNRQVYLMAIYLFYAAIGALVGPLYPIAVTLLYYDQRSRKEGYDVEKLMEAAGLLAPQETPSAEPV
jgi:uncharacterized metal-binding protein